MIAHYPRIVFVITSLVLCAPLSANAVKTAFRITDMDWREPHVYVNIIGCADVTDNGVLGFSINPGLQASIQTDSEPDGNLDLSYLITFDPLDQAGAGGTLTFGGARCTAPMAGTTCFPEGYYSTMGSYSNMAAVCLDAIAGTTYAPYTPEITASSPPCFVASMGTLTLDVGLGITMTLTDSYIAGAYVGAPASDLVNGLIRGFISETDANNTILPASMPIVGGKPLSFLFPGGDPPGPDHNCTSHSDKDIGPGGVMGWYVYFNFTAERVPIPTAVGDLPSSVRLDAPYPNPFNPSMMIHYTLGSSSRVQLAVYDAKGRKVAELVNGDRVRGDHAASWNGRDTGGSPVGSGVYFVRLDVAGETRTQKIVLLK